jgi:predicted transcriptional regulator
VSSIWRGTVATTKADVIEMIRRMPDDVTLEEIIDAIEVRIHLDEGSRDIEEGRVISHEEAKRRHALWIN